MRVLEIGTREHTEVRVMDEKGPGNANHLYEVVDTKNQGPEGRQPFLTVCFQNGPVKENGVNGIHNEDLICIAIDRLEGFQAGDFACSENESAKYCLEIALRILRNRTDDRKARGVEGTNVL